MAPRSELAAYLRPNARVPASSARPVLALALAAIFAGSADATITITGGGVDVFTNGATGRLGSTSGPLEDNPPELSGTSGNLFSYAAISGGPISPGDLPTLPGSTGVVQAASASRLRFIGDSFAMRIDAAHVSATGMANLDNGSHVANSQAVLHYEFTVDVPVSYTFSGRLALDDQDVAGSVRLLGPSAAHVLVGQPHRDFSFSGTLMPGSYQFDAAVNVASNGFEIGNVGSFSEQGAFSAILQLGEPCDPNQEPAIFFEPQDLTTCPGSGFGMTMEAGGAVIPSYEWQIELPAPMPPGTWVALSEVPTPLPCGATAFAEPASSPSAVIVIDPCDDVSEYRVRCLVSSTCGGLFSRVATLTVCSGCEGDVDCNCAVDLDDLLIVLGNFGATAATPEQGDLDADADVDLDDLLLVLGGFGVACT